MKREGDTDGFTPSNGKGGRTRRDGRGEGADRDDRASGPTTCTQTAVGDRRSPNDICPQIRGPKVDGVWTGLDRGSVSSSRNTKRGFPCLGGKEWNKTNQEKSLQNEFFHSGPSLCYSDLSSSDARRISCSRAASVRDRLKSLWMIYEKEEQEACQRRM